VDLFPLGNFQSIVIIQIACEINPPTDIA